MFRIKNNIVAINQKILKKKHFSQVLRSLALSIRPKPQRVLQDDLSLATLAGSYFKKTINVSFHLKGLKAQFHVTLHAKMTMTDLQQHYARVKYVQICPLSEYTCMGRICILNFTPFSQNRTLTIKYCSVKDCYSTSSCKIGILQLKVMDFNSYMENKSPYKYFQKSPLGTVIYTLTFGSEVWPVH